MHDGKVALIPQRLEGRQRRMQSEETVKIEHLVARNIDARPHRVIGTLAMGYDDVEPIRRAALKNHHQPLELGPRFGGTEHSASQETRDRSRTDHSQGTVAKKYAACDGHHNSSWWSDGRPARRVGDNARLSTSYLL